MRGRVLALFVAAAAAVLVAPAAHAYQYDLDYTQNHKVAARCPLADGTVGYQFAPDSDPQWHDAVRAGFAEWDGLNDYLGFTLTNVDEVPVGSTNTPARLVVVTLKDYGQFAGATGGSDCNVIHINTYEAWESLMTAAAAHEMGHVLSLRHTGRDDSFVGNSTDPYPAMTTCIPKYEEQYLAVRNDERAAVGFLYEPRQIDGVGAEFRPVTGNIGFENGLSGWAAGSGSSWALRTGSAGGYHSGYLQNTGASALGYQRTSFTPPMNAEGYRVFATGYFHKHASTDVGTVGISVVERVVAYAPLDSGGVAALGDCDSAGAPYSIARNVNARTYVGNPVQIGYGTCVPQASYYAYCESEWGDTAGSTIDYYGGSDLTVEIRSNMKTSTGAWAGVDVENAQVGHWTTVVGPDLQEVS